MNAMQFDAVQKVFEDFGDIITKMLADGLSDTKDATGDLRGSIRFSITRYATNFNFQVSLADYYKYVNDGRRPGATPPPIAPILKWIRDKMLIIDNGKLQVRSRGGSGHGMDHKRDTRKVSLLADSARVTNMAYAISRSIGKKGIKPTPFVTGVIESDIWQKLREDLTAAAGQDITLELKQRLET